MPLLHQLQKLAIFQQKFKHYFAYAIGEIIIIVMGILIALHLQNKNQLEHQEQLFSANMQELYNASMIDLWYLQLLHSNLADAIQITDELLTHGDKIAGQLLPSKLYYLDLVPQLPELESSYYLSRIEVNPANLRHNEILKQVTSFVNNRLRNLDYGDARISQLLQDHHVPRPGQIFGLSGPMHFNFSIVEYHNQQPITVEFYSQAEVDQTRALLASPQMTALIRSRRAQNFMTQLAVNNAIEAARSILALIQHYQSDVFVNFEDVGLVGNALQGWDKSVPLKLTDARQAIWQGRVSMQSGSFKFRSGNSWTHNWGATPGVPGKLLYYGTDFNTEAGVFDVEINLSAQSYRITPVSP